MCLLMAKHYKVLGHMQAQWWPRSGPEFLQHRHFNGLSALWQHAHNVLNICEWANDYVRVNYLVLKATMLQWRHNGRDGVSNHQPHDCLLLRLF